MVRSLTTALKVLATAIAFIVAFCAGAALHLNLPVVRRLVVEHVNGVLASTLVGRVRVERLGGVGLTQVQGFDAYVDDRAGHELLRLEGVQVHASIVGLLQAVFRKGDLAIDLAELTVARADVNLDADDDGTLRIARAFTTPPSASPGGPSRGVRLALSRIHVDHTSIHGSMSGAPPIEADVDDLEGSLLFGPQTLEIHAQRLKVTFRHLPGGAQARGSIEAHLAQPSPRGGDRALRVSWQGTVGAVAESVLATYDAGEIDSVLDIPEARPEDLRGLWPQSPILEVASLHAEAKGTLRELRLHARAAVGRGTLEVDGPITVGDEIHTNLHAVLKDCDAHAVSSSAPTTSLNASANVALVTKTTRAISGQVDLEFAGGTVASTSLPAATAKAEFAHDPSAPGQTSASATVAIHEPGAPVELVLRLVPRKGSYDVAFDATGSANLHAASRLGPGMEGSVSTRARGTLEVDTGRIDARIDADGSDLRFPGVRVGTVKLLARASGNPSSPSIDVQLTGAELDAGVLHFAEMHAEAHGSSTHAPIHLSLVGQGADVDANADFALDQGATLRNVVASIRAGEERIVARTPFVHLSKTESRIDAAEIEGLGAPFRATARYASGIVSVKAQSKGLDLDRLAHVARIDGVAGGRVALDVDAVLAKDSAHGRATLDLSDVAFAGWTDAGAHLDVRVEGRRISGHVTANVGDLGTLDIQSSSLEVGGDAPLAWSSWRRTWGAVNAKVHVDLAKLASQLGELPIGEMGGTVDVDARLERDSVTDNTPEVDVTASTARFVLSSTKQPKPWKIAGVDATAHAHVDGDTGQTSVDITVTDAAGVLTSITAKSAGVPYGRILESDNRIIDAIRTMPFQAKLTIAQREIDGLPSALRPKGAHGQIAATVDWNGTLAHPIVDASATIGQGRTDVSVLSLPVDLLFTSHYDSDHGDATLRARTRGRDLVEATGHVDAAALDLLAGLGGASVPWAASLRAHFSSFPLQTVGAFDVRQISGHASGDIAIDRLHDDATGQVDLRFENLRVGDVACQGARIQAQFGRHVLSASAKIEQEDGYAEAKASVGAHWGRAMVPSIDPAEPSDISLTARELRAELLLPFVSGVFSRLDGRMNGTVRLQIDPAAKTVHPQGTIALKNGTFELALLGGEFHEASAKLVLTPDGVIRLEDATARGLSGRLEVAATARFDGAAFGGARAVIQIPPREAMPLVFDGVEVGIVDGRFDVTATRAVDHHGIDVLVDVPRMHVQLPTAASHDVQSLGGMGAIDVGVRSSANEFVPVMLDAASDTPSEAGNADRTPVKVTLHLGHDVEVQRGTDLDMRLEGAPTLLLGSGEPRATGRIELARGTLDVEGKRFDIQGDSTVTFVGDDPTNPQVVLTAGWTAPDGTEVFADFIGPLKTAKVTLRSQPSRTKSEILALILFGTTDEQAPAGSASPQATGAVGAAGGAATAPINRALGGVNHMLDNFGLAGGISTKIDTSTTNPRPEVELQIARDISLQIAWVLGVPPPGSNPDTTLLTLNWRFLRQWSLVTTVGDAGTSIVDVIWQRRY